MPKRVSPNADNSTSTKAQDNGSSVPPRNGTSESDRGSPGNSGP